MNIERLEKLAAFLDTLPAEKLDMHWYVTTLLKRRVQSDGGRDHRTPQHWSRLMDKKPKYICDEVRHGAYVRAWKEGRGRRAEIIVQVWRSGKPEGKPAGDWAISAREQPVEVVPGSSRKYDQSIWDCETACCIWGAAVIIRTGKLADCGPMLCGWTRQDEHRRYPIEALLYKGDHGSVPEELLKLLDKIEAPTPGETHDTTQV